MSLARNSLGETMRLHFCMPSWDSRRQHYRSFSPPHSVASHSCDAMPWTTQHWLSLSCAPKSVRIVRSDERDQKYWFSWLLRLCTADMILTRHVDRMGIEIWFQCPTPKQASIYTILHVFVRMQLTAEVIWQTIGNSLQMQAGQTAYRDRLAELRLAKARCLALQKDIAVARKNNLAAADLKRELIYLDKKLVYEQAKTKALSEELETPLNVHRSKCFTHSCYIRTFCNQCWLSSISHPFTMGKALSGSSLQLIIP